MLRKDLQHSGKTRILADSSIVIPAKNRHSCESRNPVLISTEQHQNLKTFINPDAGFTLIEVLIAVTILAIAVVGLLKILGQEVYNSHLLQQKMSALWLSENIAAQLQNDPTFLAQSSRQSNEKILNEELFWQANSIITPDPLVIKISIQIQDPKNKHILLNTSAYKFLGK